MCLSSYGKMQPYPVSVVCRHIITFCATVAFLWLEPARANLSDPCQNYLNLGNAKRTTSNLLAEDDHPICDVDVVVSGEWYRFEQYTGARIPESCQKLYACGTVMPIWMDGTHPTDDQMKNVTAYAHDGVDCKSTAYSIRVKRCMAENKEGVYYVYQLQEPEHCDSAYCAGEGEWCGFDKMWDDAKQACVPRSVPPVTFTTRPPPTPPSAEEEDTTEAGERPTDSTSTPSMDTNLILIIGITAGAVLLLLIILIVIVRYVMFRGARGAGYNKGPLTDEDEL